MWRMYRRRLQPRPNAQLGAFRRRPESAPPRSNVGQLGCHAQLGVFRRRPVSALSPPRPGLFRRRPVFAPLRLGIRQSIDHAEFGFLG